jgi:hypothetical protein
MLQEKSFTRLLEGCYDRAISTGPSGPGAAADRLAEVDRIIAETLNPGALN